MTEATEARAFRLTNVSQSFGAVHALQDVTIELDYGEVLGVIGENGAGKSTMIGVLVGNLRPQAGTYELHGESVEYGNPAVVASRGVSVVTQEQTLVPTLTVAENLFLGREGEFRRMGALNRRKMRKRAAELLEDLGLGYLPAGSILIHLTYPMRQMVEIAKAFAIVQTTKAHPVILLDEPTSGLSESEIEILFALIDRLRGQASFVFISHQLQDVLRVSDRLLVLKDGKVVTTIPNEGVEPSDLHSLMVGRERSADYYRIHEQTDVDSRRKRDEPLLQLKNASFGKAFRDVSLSVRSGEIVGLAGVVASGKSEAAAAMAGAIKLSHGEIWVNGGKQTAWSVQKAIAHGMLYVPPERATDSVFLSLNLRHNISIGFLDLITTRGVPVLKTRTERKRALELIKELQVRPGNPNTLLREMSGGNQQKAMFARWSGRNCQVLIVDDPTRGIDVGTREEIYGILRRLAASGTAVVLCSESLEELIGISDRIVVFKDGEMTADIPSPATAKPAEVDVIQHMV